MSISSRDSSGSPSRRRRPRLPSWVLNPEDPFKSDPLSIIRPHATRRLSMSDDITGFFGNRRTRARSVSNQRPQTARGAPNNASSFPPTYRASDTGRSTRLERIPASPFPSTESTVADVRGRQTERSQPAATAIVVGQRRVARMPVAMGTLLGNGNRVARKKSFVGLENHPIPSTPFDPFGDTSEAPFPDIRRLDRKETVRNKGVGRKEAKRKRPISFLGRFRPFSKAGLVDIKDPSCSPRPRSVEKPVAATPLHESEMQRARSVDEQHSGQSHLDHIVTRIQTSEIGIKRLKPEKRKSMLERLRHVVLKSDKSL